MQIGAHVACSVAVCLWTAGSELWSSSEGKLAVGVFCRLCHYIFVPPAVCIPFLPFFQMFTVYVCT